MDDERNNNFNRHFSSTFTRAAGNVHTKLTISKVETLDWFDHLRWIVLVAKRGVTFLLCDDDGLLCCRC